MLVCHLLAKGLNCTLDESLLSVHVQFAILFIGHIGKLIDATVEEVHVFVVALLDITEDGGNLVRKSGAVAIDCEEVSIGISSNVCHLTICTLAQLGH